MMTADDDLSRIGISLPDNLLRQFDEILEVRNYHSRSEGVRDAIRIYNINYQWLEDTRSPRKGVFTLVYDYTQGDLLHAITDIQNTFKDLIKVSLQRQVTRNRRLEILIVQGESKSLKAFSEQLTGLKAIESVRMTTVALDR
jgi:CopG family nickel-responsive transcriptional regulator